jgi:hypothetical protein
MTPQGYNRFCDRKFTEVPQMPPSPRNEFMQLPEVRLRAHAVSSVAPVQDPMNPYGLDF